jgi:hypothetical protein
VDLIWTTRRTAPLDADRNRYAAGDRHGRARHRELGGWHAELQAGLVHHHLRTHLADAATADTIPPPTVLGGSCVTFGDIAVPLLVSSSGQIQAQVPDTLQAGTHVVAARSLSTAQASDPVVVRW